MAESVWLASANPAFRLMVATSWLAPDLWKERQQAAIRAAVSAGVDWGEYLRLVERHRTPALSWAALKLAPELEIPQPASQELKERSDACRMQAVRHSLLLAAVLKGFSGAGIPAMPFKGPTLSSELYGDVGLRHARDLDLAVTQDDLERAQACLEGMGWRLTSRWFPLTPRQRESFLIEEHCLDFAHPQAGCLLELHWRNQWDRPADPAARWARSSPHVWQGCPRQAMHPVDQVLYLSIHGGEHAWFRAKWLGDLARIHAEGRVDWAAALDEARRIGQERALPALLRLLEEAYGLPLPELPGNPGKHLPFLLTEIPLQALKAPDPFATPISVASLRYRLRMGRYERLLLPQKTWRAVLSNLLYRREDFRQLPLPDSLFWAYRPLHPVLWLCRWARGSRAAGD